MDTYGLETVDAWSEGWGRCLKVTRQTLALVNLRSCQVGGVAEGHAKQICCKSYDTFPLALIGVLAPCLHTLDGSTRPPIDTSRNLWAFVSAESPFNISPSLSEVISEVSEH